jgi:putative SOS response-associated peptidase YedK
MCGRFTLKQPAEAIAAVLASASSSNQPFDVEKLPELSAQYNIAPTQMVTTVLSNPESDKREFHLLRWGLIPSWAKDMSMGAKLINARAETVAEKPAFRSAFKHRRCLVLADGFYEWQRIDGKKQPFYFGLQDGQPFCFAGLWEQWESPEKEKIVSCTILTTEANEVLKPIHDRMPVVLDKKYYDLWLNPQVQKLESLKEVLHPYPASAMTAYPVSTLVNNPKYNNADCINSIR